MPTVPKGLLFELLPRLEPLTLSSLSVDGNRAIVRFIHDGTPIHIAGRLMKPAKSVNLELPRAAKVTMLKKSLRINVPSLPVIQLHKQSLKVRKADNKATYHLK